MLYDFFRFKYSEETGKAIVRSPDLCRNKIQMHEELLCYQYVCIWCHICAHVTCSVFGYICTHYYLVVFSRCLRNFLSFKSRYRYTDKNCTNNHKWWIYMWRKLYVTCPLHSAVQLLLFSNSLIRFCLYFSFQFQALTRFIA